MTRRFALLGHPVGHSISSAMMQPALDVLAPGGRYEAADVAPGDLERTLRDLVAKGYTGFNLTHPHKVAAAGFVQRLSTAARRCGAINCIAVETDGRLTGYNTDLGGVRYILEGLTPPPPSVLLLGAGGAARAVAAAMEDMGLPAPAYATRSPDTAAAFLRFFPAATGHPWYQLAKPAFAAGFDLVVNCTPIGMFPATDEAPVSGCFRSGQAVLDLIYNPRPTRLLREARGAGAEVHDGLVMLAVQGALALSIWLELDVAPVEQLIGIAEGLLPADG
ncbi:MAG: shikimate dehydrogenase [Pseudomonadota bacterium]